MTFCTSAPAAQREQQLGVLVAGYSRSRRTGRALGLTGTALAVSGLVLLIGMAVAFHHHPTAAARGETRVLSADARAEASMAQGHRRLRDAQDNGHASQLGAADRRSLQRQC